MPSGDQQKRYLFPTLLIVHSSFFLLIVSLLFLIASVSYFVSLFNHQLRCYFSSGIPLFHPYLLTILQISHFNPSFYVIYRVHVFISFTHLTSFNFHLLLSPSHSLTLAISRGSVPSITTSSAIEPKQKILPLFLSQNFRVFLLAFLPVSFRSVSRGACIVLSRLLRFSFLPFHLGWLKSTYV